MALAYEEVLQKMGWVDGFRVPVANDENQALEAELERLLLRKAKATSAYNDAESRCDNLEKHLKHIRQEGDQNQVLLAAQRQQIDQEEDVLKTKRQEKDNLNQEVRRLRKVREDIEGRIDVKRHDLEKSLVKLEKLKSDSTWDTDAIQGWEEALKKRDEDNELLKQFSAEDQKRANDLEARRQNLQMEAVKKEALVIKLAAELTTHELILERTNKTFQQMREERNDLVKRWHTAVRMLRQRNLDIEKLYADINATQEVIAHQHELLDEQNTFLQREKDNNKEAQFEIESLNINSSRIRRERNEMTQYILLLNSERNSLKRSLEATAHDLENKRRKLKELQGECAEKTNNIEKKCEELQQLKQKLEDTITSSMSADQRAKMLERMVEMQERNYNCLVQDHSRLQSLLYRNQQKLFELQSFGKIKETSIKNCKAALLSAKKQLVANYLVYERLKEAAYDIEYKINEVENKVNKLEGNEYNPQEELWEIKIDELTETLNKHTEVRNLLQKEITRLEEDMRRLSVAISIGTEHLEIARGKLQDQVLLFEGGLKQAAVAKHRSQEKQVEENVLKLKTDQFDKAIKNQNRKLYTLQLYRVDLDFAMKEKQITIQNSLEVLKVRKRNLEEEMHRLKCDIVNRKLRIEQFQKKYYLTVMSFTKDEEGNPLSTTQLKIKNAQEKYMLVSEGDELDSKIRKTESEILAMENTVKVINMTNVNYKKSLAPVSENDDETKEIKRIEDLIADTNASMLSNKRLIHSIHGSIKQLHGGIKDGEMRREGVKSDLEELKEAYEKYRREDASRNEKIARTERQVKVIAKKIDPADVGRYQRDLMLRQLQDANNNALRQLSDLVFQTGPEVGAAITRKVQENDLSLPLGVKSKMSVSSSISCISSSASGESSLEDRASTRSATNVAQINLTLECDNQRGTCSKKK